MKLQNVYFRNRYNKKAFIILTKGQYEQFRIRRDQTSLYGDQLKKLENFLGKDAENIWIQGGHEIKKSYSASGIYTWVIRHRNEPRFKEERRYGTTKPFSHGYWKKEFIRIKDGSY